MRQHHSPYLAMSNNPVNFIDTDGGIDYAKIAEGINSFVSWYNQMELIPSMLSEIGANSIPLQYISPIENPYVTSEQGMRFHPIRKRYEMHAGIDLVGSTRENTLRTIISAPMDGKITDIKTKNEGTTSGRRAGNRITMLDVNGYEHKFFHMHDDDFGTSLSVSSVVKRGQQLGRLGNTGASTGPHLHYEIRNKKLDIQNPRDIILTLKKAPRR
jgi:murein DD-endopeptidase MepM/ murein hydrolase activator NlpD